jgi:hypothetical protein
MPLLGPMVVKDFGLFVSLTHHALCTPCPADPRLFMTNWKNSSLWNNNVWSYTKVFTVADPTVPTLLVFDGIKMGASITLNGAQVATALDQYLRYVVPITPLAGSQANTLVVTFDPTLTVDGRFMACSGRFRKGRVWGHLQNPMLNFLMLVPSNWLAVLPPPPPTPVDLPSELDPLL